MKFMKFAVAFIASTSVSASPTSTAARDDVSLRRRLDGHENQDCKQHEIDFVMVEGDALRTDVEDEIVEMLEHVGVKVNTRKLSKEEFNAAETSGDFHLSFSETWGAPYDPHAYSKGWVAKDEGHHQALAGLEAPDTRDDLFAKIEAVLKIENRIQRKKEWESIHQMVHRNAVMLPLWGNSVPTALNTKRLTEFEAGYQQYDYPVHKLKVRDGSKVVKIAPGAQTGLFQSVSRLDPHTYRPNEFFANNWVYEGLVSYGAFGQIKAALAESWEVTDADNGKGEKYTFQLRPGVTFHDGEEWNCDAAKLNFDHVFATPLIGPDYHGWYGLPGQLDSWKCNGDWEFIVTTKDKYYPFLQELSFIRPLRMLSPKDFANDADPLTSNSCHVGWGNITSADGTTVICAGTTGRAGTGPFKYVSMERIILDDEDKTELDNNVVFEGNTNYWDGAPSIKTLIIQRYENSKEVKEALLNGDIDIVWGSGVLTAQDLVELDEDEEDDIAVYYSQDINNVLLLLNSGKPPLDDINLRKTIIHAIDKKTIIDNELGGIFKSVDNVFPLDAPDCDVDLTPRMSYDLEKAEFLNCPNNSNALALGLGIGLGLFSLVLLVLAIIFLRRSKKLESEMEELRIKKGAVPS